MSLERGPASPPVPLSPFQEAMLLWEETHPYNAAHAVRFRGPADLGAWRRAIETAAARAGMGRLAIDRDRAAWSFEPAGPIEVRAIERGGSGAAGALWEAVRADLNTPFPDGPHHPVRWSIADDPGSDSHTLAAVYRHVAADAASMGAIIADAASERFEHRPRGEAGAPVLEAASGAGVHPPARGGRLRSLARAAGLYFRLRRCHRMRLRKDAGEEMRFIVADAPDGLLERLAAAAKPRGATVNDAFLAALASALAAATPGRRAHPRRRALALGFAADLRGDRAEGRSVAPGVQVGQTVLVIDDPDEPRPAALLERVAALALAEKAAGTFAGTPWSFIALRRLGRRLPRGAGARAWYRKVYPVAAGVSNVRWRGDLLDGAGRRILAYHRIAPTGPALPLVLAPTTLGERLTLGLSYHAGSFGDGEAKALAAAVIEKLESFAGA